MIKSWKELPVGVFKRLLDVEGEDFDAEIATVAILAGTTPDDILDRPLQEVKQMVQDMRFLERTPRVAKVRDEYRLGDTTYTFLKDYTDITVNQYIDFVNTPKDLKHLSEHLSIFLIPKGKKYGQGYNLQKVAQDIDQYLMYEDANSLSAFFLRRWRRCTRLAETATRLALRRAVRQKVVTKEEADATMRKVRRSLRALIG